LIIYPFGCAGARSTRRDKCGCTQSNISSKNDAGGILVPPRCHIQGWKRAARYSRIEEIVRKIENRPGHLTNRVGVLADETGESRFPDFGQLGLGKPAGLVTVLIPESIASPVLKKIH